MHLHLGLEWSIGVGQEEKEWESGQLVLTGRGEYMCIALYSSQNANTYIVSFIFTRAF